MAVVILGGAVTSLLLALFVMPGLYLLVGPGRRSELDLGAATVQQWPGLDEMPEPGRVATVEPGNGAPEPAAEASAPGASGNDAEGRS
jgi:hypothetical protein